MFSESIEIKYRCFDTSSELPEGDQELIKKVRLICKTAYAPYSRFRVGAIALMDDQSVVQGTNQENASYPIGLCAERVLLAAASAVAPGRSILTMAISYESDEVTSESPIAPCGICRQSLVEFESRFNHPMKLLLTGSVGKVIVFDTVTALLPFAFKPHHLGR